MFDLVIAFFATMPIVVKVYTIFALVTAFFFTVEALGERHRAKVIKGSIVNRTFASRVRFYCKYTFAKGQLPWQTGFMQPMREAERIAKVTLGDATPALRWAAYENMLDFALEHDLLDRWHTESEQYNAITEQRDRTCYNAMNIERLSLNHRR